MLFTSVAQAQTIKNKAGRVLATNEVHTTLTADPEKLKQGSRTGFKTDFDVTYGLSAIDKNYYLLQINAIKPDVKKGFYFDTDHYTTPGKYYSCAKLGVDCDNPELTSIWVVTTWTFNGKEYSGGNKQLDSQNGIFLNYYTNLTPPSGISYADVKSGAATLSKIEITGWTVKNEDAIITAIRKMNRGAKK